MLITREIRCWTNVVGAFFEGNSALMFIVAMFRHIVGSKWSSKQYSHMQLLRDQEVEQQLEAS